MSSSFKRSKQSGAKSFNLLNADHRKCVSQQNQHLLEDYLEKGYCLVNFFGFLFREGRKVRETFGQNIIDLFSKADSSIFVLLIGAVVDVAGDDIDYLSKQMVVTMTLELTTLEGLSDSNQHLFEVIREHMSRLYDFSYYLNQKIFRVYFGAFIHHIHRAKQRSNDVWLIFNILMILADLGKNRKGDSRR